MLGQTYCILGPSVWVNHVLCKVQEDTLFTKVIKDSLVKGKFKTLVGWI